MKLYCMRRYPRPLRLLELYAKYERGIAVACYIDDNGKEPDATWRPDRKASERWKVLMRRSACVQQHILGAMRGQHPSRGGA